MAVRCRVYALRAVGCERVGPRMGAFQGDEGGLSAESRDGGVEYYCAEGVCESVFGFE